MLDLKIDSLTLRVDDADRQEHRIRPITTRVLSALVDRLGEQVSQSSDIDRLSARPVNLNLSQTSDEQAARSIANAVLEVLAPKLGVY
jgi:hypothetical protein